MNFENENVSQLSDQYQIDISLNKLKRLLQSSNGLVKHDYDYDLRQVTFAFMLHFKTHLKGAMTIHNKRLCS